MARKRKVKSRLEGKTLVIGKERFKKRPKQLTKKQKAALSRKMGKKAKFQKKIGKERLRDEAMDLELAARKMEAKARGRTRLKRSLFASKDSSKKIRRRAAGTGRILSALGAGKAASGRGAGRPHGTYKYGMPIQQYKKALAQRRQLMARFQDEEQLKYKRRGLSSEQVSQLQETRTEQELQQPTERNEREPIQIMQKPSRRPRIERQVRVPQARGYPQPPPNVADDELRFRKWMADKTVSPRTQQLLTEIRRVQNKGKSDDIEQKRRIWERRVVGAQTNLMRAHENMNPNTLNFTEVNMEENILGAPSVFKDDPVDNILRQNKLNIMQTREAGNNLKFF